MTDWLRQTLRAFAVYSTMLVIGTSLGFGLIVLFEKFLQSVGLR